MDREGAETYLRRLAEAELRRATARPGDGVLLDECHSARLEFVALALRAAHAFDMGAANEIQAELALALALRQPRQGPGGLTPNARAQLARLTDSPLGSPSTGRRQPPSPCAPERVVPVGRVIRTRAGDDASDELHLLAYVQTGASASFTAVGYWGPGQAPDWHRPPPGVLLAGQLTGVDDQGTSYQFSAGIGPGRTEWSGMVALQPDPPRTIRWLDISTFSGEPVPRIVLTPPSAPSARTPQITMTPAAVSHGELLLTSIATGFLALASPERVPLHPSAAQAGPLSQAAGGLADIIAALEAADAVSPSSRLPGQLAGLCAHLGISGHGIAAPPAGDLPEPWLSLLEYRRHGKPERAPVPGWAVTATELPELDGARVTVLGLHNGTHGQFLHLLASGVAPEYTWSYGWIADHLPILWLCDSRWHAARLARTAQLRDSDDFLLWLRVVPPLDHGTRQIDLVATGLSAEVRARLPLTWSDGRSSAGSAARS